MKRIITMEDGRRWLVRDAVSRKAALEEIAHARATGSVGGASYVHEVGKPERCLADVVQINSDYSERQPYTTAY